MGARTNLDHLEIATLRGIRDTSAAFNNQFVKVSRCLETISKSSGYGETYACEAVIAMGHPEWCPVSLVSRHGNFGGWGYPPAPPNVIECRLSPLGALALEIEEANAGALPLLLINGTRYRGGKVPNFRPTAVLDAIAAMLSTNSIDDETLIRLAGGPFFTGNPTVEGNVEALVQGSRQTFTLRPRYEVVQDDGKILIRVTNFPGELWPDVLIEELEPHTSTDKWKAYCEDYNEEGSRLPVQRVADMSHGSVSSGHLELHIEVANENDAQVVLSALHDTDAAKQTVDLELPAALPTLIREWVTTFGSESAQPLERLRSLLSEDVA